MRDTIRRTFEKKYPHLVNQIFVHLTVVTMKLNLKHLK